MGPINQLIELRVHKGANNLEKQLGIRNAKLIGFSRLAVT
jgi:hypothetical protein